MGSASVALGLPSTTLVGRVMPKKAFYEHLKTTAAIKDEFVQKIERIEMVAALKETSVHIPATKGVAEIDVLALHLKGEEVPREAIELIARSIPNRLLFVCLANEACRLLVWRGRLHETGWGPAEGVALGLRGTTLSELWNSLCSQVVFGDADPHDLEGRLARRARAEALRRELETVSRRRRAEIQTGKRNALWDRMRAIKRELARLEAGA